MSKTMTDVFDLPDWVNSSLSSLDYWRLCDDLRVIQAALLVVGHDPSSIQNFVERKVHKDRPVGYEGAKTAISRALIRSDIQGQLVQARDYDANGNPLDFIEGSIDIEQSIVEVSSLKNWLKQRGLKPDFFFLSDVDTPNYLDPTHPRYSQKLSATITAWLEMEDEELLKGKTAKQALEKWLRENAARYGLSDEDGNPNAKGIEECAKVANWQHKGGAPKTPG